MALSRTAKFYRDNPAARKKNRQFGTYGNYDGLDVSHKKGGKIGLEKASKNRGSKSNTAGDRRARGKKGAGRKNKGNTGGK